MKLTCDRQEGYLRAALWQEGKITDLYIDSIESPDWSGALVCGQLGRVMAGNKAGWFQAGIGQKIYVESQESLQAGTVKQIRILTSFSNGKACRGQIEGEGQGPEGVIEPPPSPWQRALSDIEGRQVECLFATQEDLAACQKIFSDCTGITIAPLATEIADMSERIDELHNHRVALSSGGDIVIEVTEALTAIDINAGTARNLTAVNLAAMHEIARHIRLRNIGGIIVIDALKMSARADKGKVIAALKRACEDDPAQPQIFGMTKLGLIEMTRKRRGPSLMEL